MKTSVFYWSVTKVRPIKWKKILQGFTIWNQKMSHYNSVEPALKIVLILSYFYDYSKSAREMILFLPDICYHTPILCKTAEKPTVMSIFTAYFFWKHSEGYERFWSDSVSSVFLWFEQARQEKVKWMRVVMLVIQSCQGSSLAESIHGQNAAPVDLEPLIGR